MTRYQRVETALGAMLLAAEGDALAGVWFSGQRYFPARYQDWTRAAQDALLRQTHAELEAYFAGERRHFTMPLAPPGTPFQRRVWQALSAVGYGDTTTYGRLAHGLGLPGAARAVGAAVGRNPISVIIPCHRALGAGGALTGYAGGLERKQALLALEGAGAPAVVAPVP